MALIKLEGMEFYAYHGCFSEEQIIGNKFIVDVEFVCDTQEAEQTDKLIKTIDYQEVYNVINKEMAIKSKLMEHVGRRLINAVKSKFPTISQVSIKISKCNPPLGGKLQKVSFLIKEK